MKKTKHQSRLKSRLTHKRDHHIKILSYNISWESMSGEKHDWPLCSNNIDNNHPKHNSICVGNIGKVIEENTSDFVVLQEAADYKILMKESPRLKNMNYKLHKSGKDVVITFWNNKFKLHKYIFGEFEHGRPWLATIFSNGLCLINVHLGHYQSLDVYKKLNHMIKYINSQFISSIKRYIISGDFNYDIKKFSNDNNFILDNQKFYYNKKHILTCCVNRTKHYDHVIDTLKPPLDIIIPDVHYMASDHKPILATLQ